MKGLLENTFNQYGIVSTDSTGRGGVQSHAIFLPVRSVTPPSPSSPASSGTQPAALLPGLG